MTDFYDFTTARRAKRIDSTEKFSSEIVFPPLKTEIKLYRIGPLTNEQIAILGKKDCPLCKGTAVVGTGAELSLCECTGLNPGDSVAYQEESP